MISQRSLCSLYGSTSVVVGRSGNSPDLVYKLSINCCLPSQVPVRCPGCTNFMQPLSACEGRRFRSSKVAEHGRRGQILVAGCFTVLSVYLIACPSLILIEALPSYVTGGSVRFRVQWFNPSVALNANPCCSGFDLLQGLWGITTQGTLFILAS